MRKRLSPVLLCAIFILSAVPARPQAVPQEVPPQATIEPERKTRLVLQSHLNSKLNEPGDPITAVLDEPLFVNGEMVLPKGAVFHGKVTEATPAGRRQKNGKIALVFEYIRMTSGEVPVAVEITAIDDWDNDEKLKADDEGQVEGNRSGRRTAENVARGGSIGMAGGLATVLLGGGRAAGGGVIAGGLLGGLLLTKGGDVRVAPGAMLRIRFAKPVTLPVIPQAGAAPAPAPEPQDAAKKP